MTWEYWLVYATYYAFPRRDGRTWKMRGLGEDLDDEFIKAEEAAKVRLWADGRWGELGLDPNVDWHRVHGARIIWDPWAECFRREVDGLNSFGQREWEVVAVYPFSVPAGSEMPWWGRPAMVYVLKRALPLGQDEGAARAQLPSQS